MKKVVFLTVLVLFASFHGVAQQRTRKEIRKTAIADGKRFQFTKTDSLQFKKEHRKYRSDLLKPTKLTTPDSLLLQDSLYNDVFRSVAYAKYTKGRAFLYASALVVGLVSIYVIGFTSGSLNFIHDIPMPM